jgi:hypothetical protein
MRSLSNKDKDSRAKVCQKYAQFNIHKSGGWPADINVEKIFDCVDHKWDFQQFTDYKKSSKARMIRQKTATIKHEVDK